MDKKYNLLYIHELVHKHIQKTLENLSQHKVELAKIYLSLKWCKEPYGVTQKQKKVLSQFEQDCTDLIRTIEKNPEAFPGVSSPGTSISYREYKEKINLLEKWLIQESKQILFYPLYISNFDAIIEDYKQLISKPVIRSFHQKNAGEDTNKESNELQEYLQVLNECFDKTVVESILQQAQPREDEVKLTFKDNVSARAKRYLPTASSVGGGDIEESSPICNDDDDDDSKCKVYSGIHFTDLSRVNLNQKYKYEKKQHFKDTVKQYQGLQNKFIPDKVIQDVMEMIRYHGLYDDNADDPYHKLTKDHVRSFLDEKKYPKFYEDLQLIYSKITGKPCPNIARYEKKLYEDFDSLVDAFLMLKINRKNFLNSHYVLRQLLFRQGHRIPENDLSSLKTTSRIQTHDEIYQRCCDLLNWNFNPKH